MKAKRERKKVNAKQRARRDDKRRRAAMDEPYQPLSTGNAIGILRMYEFLTRLGKISESMRPRVERDIAAAEAYLDARGVDAVKRSAIIEEELRQATPQKPPSDWLCVVQRQTRVGLQIYNRGSVMPPDAPGIDRLVRAGFVKFQSPSTVTGNVLPVDIPTPAPPEEKPEAVIVPDDDPVASWKQCLEITTAAFKGDAGKARDALLCDKEGGPLYERAVRVDAERQSRQRGEFCRRIVRI
jgi:hypothetical protein